MISTATKTLQTNNKTIYVALLSTLTFSLFRLYSGIGSMVGMGDSTGCFISRTNFCIDLRTGTSEI